ncbi:MAG TPA: ubiquinol-cytochrome c reductase iron-sulfur subunit [Bacilli bacterium]
MSIDNKEIRESGEAPVKRKSMSRRQFLTYTLGGTGGFLAGIPLISHLRFAIDPMLQPKADSAWVKVVEESQISEEPKSFSFKVHQIDAWYESDPQLEAWISRSADGKIFALSPVCKHLGCTINWNNNPEFVNEYFCHCHGAHYTKDGKNLAVAPNPLDEFSVKLENGFVYLGKIVPNTKY